MLAASPDLPAPQGSASMVRPEVFMSRLDQLVELGMGLPLASLVQNDGVYMKIFFSHLSEETAVFIPTAGGREFLEELRVKLVSAV
jgi:hypothetical protein